MSMLAPLQAHTNVRDVLAPLFCNGRSFANLIDELSRHFKFESSQNQPWRAGYNTGHHGAHTHDADDDAVLEASSESQSTDSEAEVRRSLWPPRLAIANEACGVRSAILDLVQFFGRWVL